MSLTGRINQSKSWSSIRSIVTRDRLIILTILVLYLILISPDLMPSIHKINANDEAKYIDSGRSLVDLQLRELAWGPLVSLLYASLHLVFRSSLDWFLLEAWVGRLILFSLMWISTLYLASKLKAYVHIFVVAGVLFVSVPFFFVVSNQSDAVFASFSAIALAQLLSFSQTKNLRDVWIGSAALGLAALARIDTLAWLILFAAISFTIGFRRISLGRMLLAALVPALGFIVVFVIISRIATGSFEGSIGSLGPKVYEAFEQNQPIPPGSETRDQYAQAGELFGTREENRGSVFRAIFRNPSEFVLRILGNARGVPNLYLSAFGKLLGPVVAIFALLGILAMYRRRALTQLAILFLWYLPSLFYLGFLSRHVVSTATYLALIFASIGITYAFGKDISRVERNALALLFVALAAFGWIDDKPGFLAAGLIMILIFTVIWLLGPRISPMRDPIVVPLFLMFFGGLLLRGAFTFPNFRVIGNMPEERAIHFLQISLPAGSKVVVPISTFAIAAGMEDVLPQDLASPSSPQELHAYLTESMIRAVYTDTRYSKIDPSLKTLLAEGLGNYFDQGFVDSNGDLEIVLVVDQNAGK